MDASFWLLSVDDSQRDIETAAVELILATEPEVGHWGGSPSSKG